MDDPFLLLFGFGVFGMLLFLVIAAFSRHSPDKKKRLEELAKKNASLKMALLEVSIKQVFALNAMLETYAISRENYFIELSKIYQQCTEAGIDISILKQIKPFANLQTKEDLKNKILNTSVTLNESGSLNDDDLNEIIDKTLDS